jgi:tRNA(Ile)-lysidine synthase
MSEIASWEKGQIARPLLSYSREILEDYARDHELNWVEDESNQNTYYSRNYLRQQIIPLLKQKWPRVVSNLARTAQHCQQAKVNLDDLAVNDHPELISATASLSLTSLKLLSIDRVTNVLRFWLKKNNIGQLPSTIILQKIIFEVLLARSDATPLVSWNGFHVRRYQQRLYLDKNQTTILPSYIEWSDFPSPLMVFEHKLHLIAEPMNQGLIVPRNNRVKIKFRQGGEDFYWHGQNKQLKKLFQEWSIPPWQRDRIPLIYINEQLAAVVGYAVSDLFFSQKDGQCWQIINKT